MQKDKENLMEKHTEKRVETPEPNDRNVIRYYDEGHGEGCDIVIHLDSRAIISLIPV